MEPSFKRIVIKDVNPLSGVVKTRVLHVPNEALKKKQRMLLRELMREIFRTGLAKRITEFATGCFPGCSPVKNVLRHKGNTHFYIIDIKDAYSSVDIKKMVNILSLNFGYEEKEIKDFLETYCFDGGLMTGSCVSPLLFNIYCYYEIDVFIYEKILKDHPDIVYTRYLDDLCFSSRKPSFSRRLRKKIREIIYAAGFQINHKKCALLTLDKGPIFISGIGIRQDWTLFLPRRILNKIKGLIHLSLSRRARNLWKKVEGYMAFFKYIIKSRPKTQTEKKLLKLYYKAKPIFSVP